MIPQYRTLKSKFSKYRLKKSSIPQYRKPPCPPLKWIERILKKKIAQIPRVMVDTLQFHCYRLVGTFHRKNGVKFFLHDVKKRMVTLFGTLSPSLTFKLKIQTWLEVCNHLVVAGFSPGAKEQLRNGRTCRWPRPVRPNTPNESRLGRVL